MGKDRRKDKEDTDEALGKQKDKYGKKGDGKKDPVAVKEEKSFTHQTCRHILVQKQSEALRISQEIHDGKITFNEAAFKHSEDKAGAYGLLGDKSQAEVQAPAWAKYSHSRSCCIPALTPARRACTLAARSGLLGGSPDLQGGRLASRASEDAVGVAHNHGAGSSNKEKEVDQRAVVAWLA